MAGRTTHKESEWAQQERESHLAETNGPYPGLVRR